MFLAIYSSIELQFIMIFSLISTGSPQTNTARISSLLLYSIPTEWIALVKHDMTENIKCVPVAVTDTDRMAITTNTGNKYDIMSCCKFNTKQINFVSLIGT